MCPRIRPRIAVILLAAATGIAALSQTLPAPAAADRAPVAAPAPDPGRAYAEFELGKWAELQAENQGGTQYVQEALQHYNAAMAAAPHSAYIAAQMADLLSRVGRTDDATTLAKSVVQDHPDSVVAHETLGTIYLRQLSREHQPIHDAVMDAAVAEYKRLIALAPTDASYVVMLGKLYGAQGSPALAEQQFRAALTLDPANDDAVASLVQSLAGQNRLDEASRVIDSLPEVARSGQAYANLGEAYLNQRRYTEAAAAFRQAAAARPDDPDYQQALAQALAENGNFAAALTEYQRLEKETPDDGHAPLRVAQMQMQMGQFAAAGVSLQSARALLGPDDLEVAYAGAMLDESQGHDQPALASLRELAARPGSPGTRSIFLTELARLQMRTGDTTGAESSLKQIEGLGPSYNAHAHSLAVELYSEQRDYPRALDAARAALQDQPDSRSLHLTYANLLSASGQTDAAEAAIQPLMQGTAADWDLYLALGQIREAAGQWAPALANTEHADELAATPAQHAQAVAQQGAIEARQRDYAEAEKSYRQALALDPGNPQTLNAFGYLLAEQGVHLPQALDYVRQALARDANNGAYLDSLGWVYFKMNKMPEALTNLERAARLEDHDPAILDHLAQAYDRDGKLQQAASRWQEALALLKLSPSPGGAKPQAADIQKELDAVRVRIAQASHDK